LVEKVVQELEGVQSVYFDEEITQAYAEIVTVPAHTLFPTIIPAETPGNDKKKKKVPLPAVKPDDSPI
jgi:hypothetical protein